MDIYFDSVTPTADDPVRVTFVANNMTDNIQVDILYYCPEHGWEVLQGEKISDNQVAGLFPLPVHSVLASVRLLVKGW